MSLLMDVSTIVSIATIVILTILLSLYIKIYLKTRAIFTIGLIFFAIMLVVQNLIVVYAYFAMAPLYADALLPYFLLIHIAELAGVASLLKITL
ncbi:MAG TPA: hypothetical protein VFK40_05835 [Nitrososphaeraceae archaeon]|jgi:hypothetical protein|nr:hypothetical protein [Nitrososphaeraceae archaeon]HET8793186.1 hypothetical protein [Nitrososphaeraceae archaeon]